MKKRIMVFVGCALTLFFVLFIAGCGSDKNDDPELDSSADDSALEPDEETNETEETNVIEEKEVEQESTAELAENGVERSNISEQTSNEDTKHISEREEEQVLSAYTSEEIEYARVWLQLGANQALDELNVRHIPAGEPINPSDETSADYPEDVIQLAGSRLIDGSVTYSGNGDGTINVYNVPLRWDGEYPAGESFYIDMIENTELVPIDTGDDDEVIELIEVLHILEK